MTSKEHKAYHKLHGLCRDCKNLAREGRTLCEGCANRNKEKVSRKVQEGVCVSCTKPSMEGKTRCKRCTIARQLSSHNDIPMEMYNEQLSKQGNRCAFCNKEFSEALMPVIDHVHAMCEHGMKYGCKECFRSLMCGPCNTALGLLGETLDIAEAVQRFKNVSRI